MGKLILLRHGQSTWNQENRFTGWADVDLSEQGQREARLAGQKLKTLAIDHVFMSTLKRAQETARFALEAAGKASLSATTNEALNERHYGDLQGLNKDEMRAKYGTEQVHIWRRSYDVRPPGGESLKDTCARVIPYYKAHIWPLVKKGETVLVVAHGNSLRGLIKELEHLGEGEVVSVEIPTGVPILYELDEKGQVISKGVLS